MNRLFSLCGYDSDLLKRVAQGERVFFVVSAALTILASLLAGAGMAYGAILTVGPLLSPIAFVVAALFVLNLLRLQHAGSGYPLHLPIEDIHAWRPAMAGVVVLFVFGVLISQPLVFLLEKSWLDAAVARGVQDAAAVRAALGIVDVAPPVADGLIVRGRAAWDQHPLPTTLLTLLFATLLAAPALLRRLGATVVQHYESERWIADRILVDDEWAFARDVIEATLTETAPGFRPPLSVPFADPPYNTRPLIFGLDPADFVEGRLKYVRVARKLTPETPPLPTTATPWWVPLAPPPLEGAPTLTTPVLEGGPVVEHRPLVVEQAPVVTPAPVVEPPPAAPPVVEQAPVVVEQQPAPAPALPAAPAFDADPGARNVILVGRHRASDALRSVKVMALCARYLELSPDEVLAALRAAPADAPLHAVFPTWGKLPTLLLKPADVALDLGLAPLIGIAVGRPADQIERRLRAVPGDRKVSSVFAPELARLLLRDKGASQG